MIDIIYIFIRHVKTAFLSLFRNVAMTFSAIGGVSVTLVLLTIFLMLAGNIFSISKDIEAGLCIHAVLEKGITESERKELETEVLGIKGVERMIYSTKEEELEMMIKEYGEELTMYRGKENPLADAYFITVNSPENLEAISNQISEVSGVNTALYGGSSVSRMVSMLESIRRIGFVFVVLLSALAFFLVSNAIRLTIYARRSEIAIMRNVGAENWYIKVPFVLEGMMIGIIGSLLPCVLTYYGYNYLYDFLGGKIVTSALTLLKPIPFTFHIMIILVLSGALVGFVGSLFATGKYLRWKR